MHVLCLEFLLSSAGKLKARNSGERLS